MSDDTPLPSGPCSVCGKAMQYDIPPHLRKQGRRVREVIFPTIDRHKGDIGDEGRVDMPPGGKSWRNATWTVTKPDGFVTSWSVSTVLGFMCEDCRSPLEALARKRYGEMAEGATEETASLRTMAYQQYLRTNHWQRVRDLVWNRDGPACQGCGARWEAGDAPFHTHHWTYAHRGLEHRHLGDLSLLCPSCHEIAHKMMDGAVDLDCPASVANALLELGRVHIREWERLGPFVPNGAGGGDVDEPEPTDPRRAFDYRDVLLTTVDAFLRQMYDVDDEDEKEVVRFVAKETIYAMMGSNKAAWRVLHDRASGAS